MNKYRPGPGWRYLGSGVWEHVLGVRIHIGGLVRFPDGRYIRDRHIDSRAYWFVRVNGGNRRRGLMAWAMDEFLASGFALAFEGVPHGTGGNHGID